MAGFKPLLPKHVRDRLFSIVDLNETDLVHRAAQADLEWGSWWTWEPTTEAR